MNPNKKSIFQEKYDLKHNQILSSCGKYIYHVAIIDYLQKYDFNKVMERISKIFVLKTKGIQIEKDLK
jgi:hypothetical protein